MISRGEWLQDFMTSAVRHSRTGGCSGRRDDGIPTQQFLFTCPRLPPPPPARLPVVNLRPEQQPVFAAVSDIRAAGQRSL